MHTNGHLNTTDFSTGLEMAYLEKPYRELGEHASELGKLSLAYELVEKGIAEANNYEQSLHSKPIKNNEINNEQVASNSELDQEQAKNTIKESVELGTVCGFWYNVSKAAVSRRALTISTPSAFSVSESSRRWLSTSRRRPYVSW